MILDDRQKIKKLDKSGVLASIESLADQCRQAWREVGKMKVPAGYGRVKNIVINGMGGSGLGGHIIQSLYLKSLKSPIQIVNSYSLPEYANKDTLCILSSYSGNTEEVLQTAVQAKKRKAKILGLAAGGKLGLFLEKNKLPGYTFDPKFNPCGSPRMGLGYSVFGLLSLLKKCGLIRVADFEVFEAIELLRGLNKVFGAVNGSSGNPAKRIAKAFYKKIPVPVGSEFLSGNIHVLANQFNENAKTFSSYFLIPELNHHLMEGLAHPGTNRQNLKFFFINSNLYHSRIQRRYQITKEVVRRNRIEFIEYEARAKTRFFQVLEVLLLGSYVSFYLAILNNLNPGPNPWVDYFKKRLVK